MQIVFKTKFLINFIPFPVLFEHWIEWHLPPKCLRACAFRRQGGATEASHVEFTSHFRPQRLHHSRGSFSRWLVIYSLNRIYELRPMCKCTTKFLFGNLCNRDQPSKSLVWLPHERMRNIIQEALTYYKSYKFFV